MGCLFDLLLGANNNESIACNQHLSRIGIDLHFHLLIIDGEDRGARILTDSAVTDRLAVYDAAGLNIEFFNVKLHRAAADHDIEYLRQFRLNCQSG